MKWSRASRCARRNGCDRAEAGAAVGDRGCSQRGPGAAVVAQGTVTCCFCEGIIMPMSENFFGPVTLKDTRHFAHVECALWCPEVGQCRQAAARPSHTRRSTETPKWGMCKTGFVHVCAGVRACVRAGGRAGGRVRDPVPCAARAAQVAQAIKRRQQVKCTSCGKKGGERAAPARGPYKTHKAVSRRRDRLPHPQVFGHIPLVVRGG